MAGSVKFNGCNELLNEVTQMRDFFNYILLVSNPTFTSSYNSNKGDMIR